VRGGESKQHEPCVIPTTPATMAPTFGAWPDEDVGAELVECLPPIEDPIEEDDELVGVGCDVAAAALLVVGDFACCTLVEFEIPSSSSPFPLLSLVPGFPLLVEPSLLLLVLLLPLLSLLPLVPVLPVLPVFPVFPAFPAFPVFPLFPLVPEPLLLPLLASFPLLALLPPLFPLLLLSLLPPPLSLLSLPASLLLLSLLPPLLPPPLLPPLLLLWLRLPPFLLPLLPLPLVLLLSPERPELELPLWLRLLLRPFAWATTSTRFRESRRPSIGRQSSVEGHRASLPNA